MKRANRLVAAWLLALGIAAASHAYAQTDVARMSGAGEDIRMIDLGHGIYQFTTMRDSYVRQLNSVVVVTDQDVLVFDTNTRPSSARLILAQIRRLTDKPVRFVVNSHGHPDHWSGNEVYVRAFPNVDIIATQTTADLMHQMAGVWLPRFSAELERRREASAIVQRTGRRSDGSTPTPDDIRQQNADLRDYETFVEETRTLQRVFPTFTFQGALNFTHGGREFRFISLAGDQEGTTVLYLPQDGVLLTGDAVALPLPYVGDTLSPQVAGLEMLNELGARVIVPGHGPAQYDNQFLLLELDLLRRVIREVAQARASGVHTLEQIQEIVTIDDLREQFTHGDPDLEARYPVRVSEMVEAAYSEQSEAQSP